MPKIERPEAVDPARRAALAGVGALIAASPLAAAMAQADPRPLSEHRRARSLAEMQTAFDFEPVFFGNVTAPIYDYTAHGDGSEFTLRRNRQAFDWVDIVPSGPAVPPASVDLSSTLLGVRMRYPILVAPTATMKPLHPDAEPGMFKAATAAANTLMVLSINTSTPVEQVVAAAPSGTLWGQFYPLESVDDTGRQLGMYQAAGCNGIVVTVDQQASFYERTTQDRHLGGIVRRGSASPHRGAASTTGAARYGVGGGRLWYSWQYIDTIRKVVKGPLVIKGIVEPGTRP